MLPAEEFRVAEAYFNLRPVGNMHHNPAKNVLHTPRTLDEVAKALGIDEVKARELLRAAKETMYAARLKRRMVDRVLTRCAKETIGDIESLMLLLRRFAAEAARDDARLLRDELVDEHVALTYRFDRAA